VQYQDGLGASLQDPSQHHCVHLHMLSVHSQQPAPSYHQEIDLHLYQRILQYRTVKGIYHGFGNICENMSEFRPSLLHGLPVEKVAWIDQHNAHEGHCHVLVSTLRASLSYNPDFASEALNRWFLACSNICGQ